MTLALHGVGLAGTGLAVGKDANFFAVNDGGHVVLDISEDVGLCKIRSENLIEDEALRLDRLVVAREEGSTLSLIRCHKVTAIIDLELCLTE